MTSRLYERLRGAILSLELVPGERLTERGLEVLLQGSRTPVRAALARLESEGLVERAGRVVTVAPIDLEEVRELSELRQAVEPAAARLSVDRCGDEELSAARRQLRSTRGHDQAESVRSGRDFHVELARLSGNRFLVDVVDLAMLRLSRSRWIEARTSSARALAAREHGAILDAVCSRDGERAADLLLRHISSTNERLVALLEREQPGLRRGGWAVVRGRQDRGGC